MFRQAGLTRSFRNLFCLSNFPVSLRGVGSPLRAEGRPIGAYPPAWNPTGWKRPRWEESLKIKSLCEKERSAVMGDALGDTVSGRGRIFDAFFD